MKIFYEDIPFHTSRHPPLSKKLTCSALFQCFLELCSKCFVIVESNNEPNNNEHWQNIRSTVTC